MGVYFLRRGEQPAMTVAVTITGEGNTYYCYAIINGTGQYSAGTHEVNTGDTITFGVYGRSSSYYGYVTIDGTEVLRATSGSTQLYKWTVPRGISTIEISLTIRSSNSIITVTTA